mgnify:CR=1 FL=1|tara:strand:+ start:752 stop:2008 length:1257 start_codon:yes stop_codon:yes gene_type:complete
MANSLYLDPVQILYGPKKKIKTDSVLIIDGYISCFGNEARDQAKVLGIPRRIVPNNLLAPPLVDPHSVLEEPINGNCENLNSLRISASKAGYGQIALLPRSKEFRDSPEKIRAFPKNKSDINIHLWGNFSHEGKGERLSPHGDLIQHGAIGLTDDDFMINTSLLQRGFALGEMGEVAVLIAPRDKKIQGKGIFREGIDTLRAGWMHDPTASEIIPLQQILDLHYQFPEKSIRIMNVSTNDAVQKLKNSPTKTQASVCWWHLVSDTTTLKRPECSWRVSPSLGGLDHRKALIKGVKERILSSIAVNSIPLDEEDTQLPLEQREPGISGHQLVLPSLWQELIVKEKFSIEQLWSALSFGPSEMIKSSYETLKIGSRRWILFDPNHYWIQSRYSKDSPKAANQPWEGKKILGKVINTGLKA